MGWLPHWDVCRYPARPIWRRVNTLVLCMAAGAGAAVTVDVFMSGMTCMGRSRFTTGAASISVCSTQRAFSSPARFLEGQ